MQQVSVPSTRSAVMIDPRRLPARTRGKPHPAVVAVSHKWVLHQRLVLKLGAGLFCAVLLASAFQVRGGIMQTINQAATSISGGLAAGGLGVAAIEITGQSITSERAVLDALGLAPGKSILDLDADLARARLLALPAVETAEVRKNYPNHVAVALTEKAPIARWSVDGETMLIDAKGTPLGPVKSVHDAGLPLVIGGGAADDAQVLIRTLGMHPAVVNGIVAFSRIADRRWDLIYDTGLRVQLPEIGLAEALERLDGYQRDHRLLDRDLSVVDLRVAGIVAVQLVKRDENAVVTKTQ